MWQCQAQTPGVLGLVEHRVALARGDVDRVAGHRLVERHAVLGDDPADRLVQVHRVGHQPLVEVVDLHHLADAQRCRLGAGEALAVEAQPDRAGVVEHHVDLLVDLWCMPLSCSTCGIGMSSIVKAPNRPLGTCSWALWCEW